MGLVVLLHAGLIGRAAWRGDDYYYIASLRTYGWRLPLDRIEHWSPRLWSEMLLALYGLMVIQLHRPLAGSVEAVLWSMLAAAALLPAWRGEDRRLRLLTGLALLALCLLGHPIAEVFFWPAGSLAYIPTLAGLLWLFWCLHDGPDRHPAAACCALLLAAGSSETGLFLTLALTLAALALAALIPAARRGLRPLLWSLPALVLALAEALILAHGRVGQIETIGPGRLALHHALPSLLAGSAAFARETLSPGAARLATWLLVLLGMRWCGLGRKQPACGPWLALLAAALLLACWITILAAFYQFGELCCQRHATMRDCFMLLAMASLGAWSARRWPRSAAPSWAPAPLLLACLGLFALRAPALRAAWRLYPATLHARTLTWQSGLQHDSPRMTLHLGPDDRLIGNGAFLTPGSYPRPGDVPWYVTGVLWFFGKDRVEVEK